MIVTVYTFGEVLVRTEVTSKLIQRYLADFDKIPAEDFQGCANALSDILRKSMFVDPREGVKTDLQAAQLINMLGAAGSIASSFPTGKSTFLQVTRAARLGGK